MLKYFPNIKDYFSLAVKLFLILSIINSIYYHLWHLMSTSIFLLILMFIPQVIKKSVDIRIPKEFEILLLIFVIITLFFGQFNGVIAPLFFGIAISFIGFLISFILYASNQIKKNPLLIILFSFNLAVAFGFGLEILKYYLKFLLGYELSLSTYTYSMMSMTYVIIGALIASIIGYIYMKTRMNFIKQIVKKFINSNPNKFSLIDDPSEILELIKLGENEKLEFKSTLRMNLYLKQIDRKIEFSVLKTLTAFMNSNGGKLFIGVNDSGEINGISQDKFENYDKFNLHLTNLIKDKIGKEFLPFINMKSFLIEGKTIVEIECKKSDKPIFLKDNKDEEFFIRAGPSSVQLNGRELVEYISRRFSKHL